MINKKDIPKEFEVQFNEAIKLRDNGEYEAAVQILEKLVKERQDIAATFGILGGVYWDLGDNLKAIENFKKAVSINPKSELASLGLFHNLNEFGNEEEAIQELKRFLSIAESDEYQKILEENNLKLEDL